MYLCAAAGVLAALLLGACADVAPGGPPPLATPSAPAATSPPGEQLAPPARTCPPGNPIRTPPSALPGTGGCP